MYTYQENAIYIQACLLNQFWSSVVKEAFMQTLPVAVHSIQVQNMDVLHFKADSKAAPVGIYQGDNRLSEPLMGSKNLIVHQN